MKLRNTKILLLGMVIIIAFSGSIFFFPMNIDGKYTCLYHRLIDHSHPLTDVMISDHKMNHHHSTLLSNYLHLYALPWWISIGLVSLCIYLVLRFRNSVAKKES